MTRNRHTQAIEEEEIYSGMDYEYDDDGNPLCDYA